MKSNFRENKFRIVILMLVIFFVAIIGMEKLTNRTPLTSNEAIQVVNEENGVVTIDFDSRVAGSNVFYYKQGPKKYYDILAWQTPINKWTNNSHHKTEIINFEKEEISSVYYIGISGLEDIIIYGDSSIEHRVTLPRLAMNYYLGVVIISLIVFATIAFLFKDRERVNKLATMGSLFSFSYIICHLLVMGINSTTHFMIRDLTYVLISTAILSFNFMLYYLGITASN